MTHDQIRELGSEARSLLDEQERVGIEYCPGNGTRYAVVIVNAIPLVRKVGWSYAKPEDEASERGEIVHQDGRDRHWLVVIENFGTAAMLSADGEVPFPSYLAEKLTHGNIADASALRLLLGGVMGIDLSGVSLSDAGIRDDRH